MAVYATKFLGVSLVILFIIAFSISYVYYPGKSDMRRVELDILPATIRHDPNHNATTEGSDPNHNATTEGSDAWKWAENEKLSAVMQARLHKLQNPANCETSRRAVFDHKFRCGMGCYIHAITYALNVAYITKRTLIVNLRAKYAGWDNVFVPVGSSCTYTSLKGAQVVDWSNYSDEALIVSIPKTGVFSHPALCKKQGVVIPRQLGAVPRDIATPLMRFHGYPALWFQSQFFKFVYRLQPRMEKHVTAMAEKLGVRSPIVGVQVRRTDKISEAKYVDLDAYMRQVDEYYGVLEERAERAHGKGGNGNRSSAAKPTATRRVFLATDDANVVDEARKRYTDYTFITTVDSTQSRKTWSGQELWRQRYGNDSSLIAATTDVWLLSMCDHLICTFSSNMCKMAYELMQTRHGDATNSARSVDLAYHFLGGSDQRYAWKTHVARRPGEIDLRVGDVIDINYKHDQDNLHGFTQGRSLRLGRKGLFPTFKTRHMTRIDDFNGSIT